MKEERFDDAGQVHLGGRPAAKEGATAARIQDRVRQERFGLYVSGKRNRRDMQRIVGQALWYQSSYLLGPSLMR